MQYNDSIRERAKSNQEAADATVATVTTDTPKVKPEGKKKNGRGKRNHWSKWEAQAPTQGDNWKAPQGPADIRNMNGATLPTAEAYDFPQGSRIEKGDAAVQ